MQLRAVTLLAFVFAATLTANSRAGEFSFQPIGYLPAEYPFQNYPAYSAANGVSDDGKVVAVNSSHRAAMWTKADGLVELPSSPGNSGGIAWDVSADGTTIVGGSSGAVKWTDSGTTVTPLHNLSSVAYGASSDASVIVGAQTSGGSVAMRLGSSCCPYVGRSRPWCIY